MECQALRGQIYTKARARFVQFSGMKIVVRKRQIW